MIVEDDGSCPKFREFANDYSFYFPQMTHEFTIRTGKAIIFSRLWTLDRDSGEPLPLAGQETIYDVERLTSKELLLRLRDHLTNLVVHEVNEQIKYKGERPFDPHERT